MMQWKKEFKEKGSQDTVAREQVGPDQDRNSWLQI